MAKNFKLELGLDPYDLKGEEKRVAAQLIQKRLNAFLRGHGIPNVTITGVNLPLDRIFEIHFDLLCEMKLSLLK